MKRIFRSNILLAGIVLLIANMAAAQPIEPIPFGDFEQWAVRRIKESAILGGNETEVYMIAPRDTIVGAIPYRDRTSPWSSSNVLAVVAGITKTSTTVFPEKRGDGWCARLETRLVKCKALGIVNITVLASGTIYLGRAIEPISGTSDPYAKLDMGIPFTRRPAAVVLDYKARIDPGNTLTKATGLGKKTLPGKDCAEILVMLQHRWEDAEGNVYARRTGTGSEIIHNSVPEWVDGHRVEIRYGDISDTEHYNSRIALSDTYYCENSRGEMVPIREVGWSPEGEEPTHLILMLSSGSQGAYMGALGNSLTVDNIGLAY